MARSKDQWERRTAILSTAHFIMKLRETDDTFRIATLLINDKEDFVQKGVGWMLRTAGGVDRPALTSFLDKHAVSMPRQVLRAAVEKFDKKQKDKYLSMK
jgi:3-methyladenine DNA glycosylase AlkD